MITSRCACLSVRFCVIGIALLAAGLLVFPAIAALRDSANAAKSANNMRQIGLSVHNFHDANNGRFALICDHGPGIHPGSGVLSWYWHIMPFLEGG